MSQRQPAHPGQTIRLQACEGDQLPAGNRFFVAQADGWPEAAAT